MSVSAGFKGIFESGPCFVEGSFVVGEIGDSKKEDGSTRTSGTQLAMKALSFRSWAKLH